MSFNFSPKVVTDNLIYYLDASNSKSYIDPSTSWINISKVNNTSSTLVNGVAFSTSNKGCLALDGVNDYIALPQITANQTYGKYSFSLWFSPSITINPSNTNNYMLIEAQNTLINGVDNYLYFVSGGAGRLTFQTFNPLSTINSTTNNWVAGKWYNAVGTYDISTGLLSLYINGALQASTTIANCYFNTNSYFNLGVYSNPTKTWNFPGKINNFMVYTKTLSSNEVLQNYNTIKTRFGL